MTHHTDETPNPEAPAPNTEGIFPPGKNIDWSHAPHDWNWAAQDEDGRWFWYGVKPILGIGGGVWRAPSRAQEFAGQGAPNPYWYETLQERPA